jgi:stage II sporulation protein M
MGMIDQAVKSYFPVLSVLFVAAVFGGFIAPPSVRKEVADLFQSIVEPFMDISGGEIFFLILLNNTFATLMTLLGGVLFGVLPVVSASVNGFVMGVLLYLAAEQEGLRVALFSLLPHGIFEIPAVLIAASYGLWLGAAALRRFRGKEDVPLGSQVRYALTMYFRIVFPLLVIAAAIETALILDLL